MYIYVNVCICICICTYIYVYMHIYICIYTCIFIRRSKAPGHVQSPIIYGPVHEGTYLYICSPIIYGPVHVCTYLYICSPIIYGPVHVCTYLYICIYIHIISIYLYICIFPWSTHTVSRLEKWSGLFFFLEKSPAHRMHLLLQCVFWRWFRRRMDFGFFKDSLAQEPYLLRALLMEYRSVFLECRAVLASIS